jgi:hypothetical protein
VQLSFLEKYQLRRKYFDNIYQDNQLIFIAEKELAGLTFHKVNMEGDISYIKSQNKWVEPSEGEDLKGSRLRWANMILSFERESLKSTKLEKIAFSIKFRWKDLWSLMGEGLRDSFGSLVLIALIPYFLSILLRSIVWAIKNR